MTIDLEAHLRARRAEGRKLLVPYLSAGCREDWLDVVRAVALAGADAIEIGIPFSDPVMDGPVIEAANVRALERGTTPASVVNELAGLGLDIPLAVMTYYNLVFRFGHERFAAALHQSGVSGVILPDLPMEVAGPWIDAADANDVQTVFLVAPNTPDDRMAMITERTKGFVYGISLLGITGVREELAASATRVAKRLKAATDVPVLIGVGISTPEQARAVVGEADGVIVGSAIVRQMIDGASPEQIGSLVGEFRSAIDD